MKTLYTAEATAQGGRDGKVATSDKKIQENLSVPESMGGSGGDGVNPEQLFASGYSACFDGALQLVADQAGEDIDSTVTAKVSIGKQGDGLGLAAHIKAEIKGVDQNRAEELVEKANQTCPYSKATKGNIDITIETVAV